MTRLVAGGLSVVRGGRRILADVSLALEGGSFVALLGANGAGKSTLLAVLAGLLTPNGGGVMLDDRPLASIPRRDLAKRRAFLPQDARAEWPISVERLVALGLTPQLPAFGGLPAAFDAQINAALEACDMLGRRGQAVTTLSGGELGRAMLARALVGDPDILIADEPLAGLDPRHALEGVVRLRALADAGKLVIASIHDLTLAARHASHVAVLLDGALIAFGPTATTLTSALVRDAFDVDACLTGSGRDALVDFVAAVARV
ncbi:ABC transporter ATP-binding protein [Sphingomonas sp. MMS24-J13]|uniref:ABC transporter ATP-binding protein n=1 Tax=Sphingomonas sp. MMS24-J13 TaxID=3238686 RepID=UPI00384B7046